MRVHTALVPSWIPTYGHKLEYLAESLPAKMACLFLQPIHSFIVLITLSLSQSVLLIHMLPCLLARIDYFLINRKKNQLLCRQHPLRLDACGWVNLVQGVVQGF